MQSIWESLMATDSGLLSLAVFIFMLGMGVFYLTFFIRKIRSEEPRDERHHPTRR